MALGALSPRTRADLLILVLLPFQQGSIRRATLGSLPLITPGRIAFRPEVLIILRSWVQVPPAPLSDEPGQARTTRPLDGCRQPTDGAANGCPNSESSIATSTLTMKRTA